MKTHIISIFDKNHMARAMACRESLARHSPSSIVYWLCLDQTSRDAAILLSIPNTEILVPEELGDQELLDIRHTRTNPEFSSTCKPAFLRYMLASGRVGALDLLVFVDPDFYFYRSPDELFARIRSTGSITVTPHRFPADRVHEAATKGAYNAGVVFFRNDATALSCLEEWRRQCIEWCYLRYENGQIGDQGYMNEWPRKYPGLVELADKGVNLSTWNIGNYKIARQDGGYRIDADPLICYHFHGLKLYFGGDRRLAAYPITVMHRGIYAPCLQAMNDAYARLRLIDADWTYGTLPHPGTLRIFKQKMQALLR